jgi:hypothetical protein
MLKCNKLDGSDSDVIVVIIILKMLGERRKANNILIRKSEWKIPWHTLKR